MADKTLCFPAGKAIAFSTGEYSDFCYRGVVVTLKECDLFKLGQEFKAEKEKENDNDWVEPQGFPSWLVANGHAFPAEIQEVHCGSYGEFELGAPQSVPAAPYQPTY